MRLIAILAALTLTVGCGEKPADGGEGATGAAKGGAKAAAPAADPFKAAPVLELIPSDTPYVFASLAPMPEALVDKLFTSLDPILKKAEGELAQEIERLKTQESEQAKVQRAILEEIQGKLSLQGFESLGITLKTTFSVYGVGVLPVIRMGLKDPKLFKDFVARIEAKAGQKAPVQKLGEQEYWGMTKDGVTAAVAIVGSELVFSAGPEAAMKKVLPLAFGQQKPAESLAKAGHLGNLAKAHGFTPQGVGYVDLRIIAATLLGKASGLNAEVWAGIGEEIPALPPVCVTEITAMVAKAPRLAVGNTSMSSLWVLEMESGLAKSLAGLAAPVPGLGVAEGTPLLAFGLGLDIPATLDFVKKKLGELKAAPYQCPMMADLNAGVIEAEQSLAAAPLPPFVNGIRGFNVVLKDAQMAGGTPSNVKGHVLLAANDPKSLVASAKQMGGPQLANFQIADDGKPVAFPMPLPPAAQQIVGAIHLAMKGNAIAASIGTGEEANLGKALGAKSVTPAPLAAVSYDTKRLMALSSATMAPDEKEIVSALTGMMGSSHTTVTFTDKGLAIKSVTSLK